MSRDAKQDLEFIKQSLTVTKSPFDRRVMVEYWINRCIEAEQREKQLRYALALLLGHARKAANLLWDLAEGKAALSHAKDVNQEYHILRPNIEELLQQTEKEGTD